MPSFGLQKSYLSNPIPAPCLKGCSWPFPLQPPLPCFFRLDWAGAAASEGPKRSLFGWAHTPFASAALLQACQLSLSVFWQSPLPIPAWPGREPGCHLPGQAERVGIFSKARQLCCRWLLELWLLPVFPSAPLLGSVLDWQPLPGIPPFFLLLCSISCILTICIIFMFGFETLLWRAAFSLNGASRLLL